jgi:hypothetical protein
MPVPTKQLFKFTTPLQLLETIGKKAECLLAQLLLELSLLTLATFAEKVL